MTSPKDTRAALEPDFLAHLESDEFFFYREELLRQEYAYLTDEAYTQTDSSDEPLEPETPKKVKDFSWMYTNANRRVVVLELKPSHVPEEGSPHPISWKDGFKLLSSYNFKQTEPTTAYVPGTPAKFIEDHTFPTTLEKDAGLHYNDQHMEKAYLHQFEPAYQAVSIMNPEETFDDVDFVVSRTTLHDLSKFLGGKSNQPFQLDLDMVNNTLFLGRKLYKPMSRSPENTFGRNFESAFTEEDPELEAAEGHYRFLRIQFGALVIAVRIEVDAYIPAAEHFSDMPLNYISSLSISDAIVRPSPLEPIAHDSPQATIIIHKGTPIPQSRIAELKTSQKAMTAPMEQMWFGRTSFWVCGRHKKGDFTRADPVHISEEQFVDWENKNQVQLSRLAWTLERLREVTKCTKFRSAVLVSEKNRPIVVYEAARKMAALPKEVVQRFWKNNEEE